MPSNGTPIMSIRSAPPVFPAVAGFRIACSWPSRAARSCGPSVAFDPSGLLPRSTREGGDNVMPIGGTGVQLMRAGLDGPHISVLPGDGQLRDGPVDPGPGSPELPSPRGGPSPQRHAL